MAGDGGGRSERRAHRRVPAPAGTLAVTVAGDGGRWPVRDVAPAGLGLESSPGVRFDVARGQLAVTVHEGTREVARCPADPLRGGWGLRLQPGAQAGEALRALYHRLRFPALGRRGAQPPGAVRALFERSGYTALKAGLAFAPAWLAAAWPAELSHEAVYTGHDGELVGHIGLCRAYPGAWLGHEIATRRDHPEALACRRALYHHFASWPRLVDGGDALLLGYYNRDRPWHRAMFEAFAASSDPDRECVAFPVDRFLLAPGGGGGLPAGDDAVDLAGAGEGGAIARLVATSWPKLAVAAFDLGDGAAVVRDCLHPAFARAGIARGRAALVLRRRGRVLGAAVIEWVDAPLSLFDVMTAIHLFLAPEAAPARGPVAALVRAAAARLDAVDPRPVARLVTAPPGQLNADAVPGLRHCETMGAIVWTGRGLARYEDHVDAAMADYRLGASGTTGISANHR